MPLHRHGVPEYDEQRWHCLLSVLAPQTVLLRFNETINTESRVVDTTDKSKVNSQ